MALTIGDDHGRVDLADGTHAGVGDRIVTRHNDRRLAIGHRWVKNGDTWTIHAINTDSSLTVTRDDGGRSRTELQATLRKTGADQSAHAVIARSAPPERQPIMSYPAGRTEHLTFEPIPAAPTLEV